jgi:sec-independent protein translocase protein TatC
LAEQKEMTFLDHLEELRWRLVRSSAAIVVLAVGIWIFKSWIMENLFLTMRKADFFTFKFLCSTIGVCVEDVQVTMQSTEVIGQFSYALMMSIVGGIILAFPYIFWELWGFVRPGLKQNELHAVKGTVFYVSILFFIGVLFGYFIVAPLSVQFFGSFQLTDEIQNNFTVSSYMSTVISTIFFSGLIFLLPVVVYFLAKLGIVTPLFLKKYRKHAIVAVLILAAVITPPDLISQVIVAIPILILYEISIMIARRIEKNQINQRSS